MPTRRTPLKRVQQNRLSAHAVEAFRLAPDIESENKDQKWEGEGGRRREYLDAVGALHRALGLRPWQITPVDVDDGAWPDWMDDHHGWEQAAGA